MPMCEFAPKSFVNILKNDVSPNPFRNTWNNTFVEEFSHLRFWAVSNSNYLWESINTLRREARKELTLQCCMTLSCLSQVW